MSLTLSHPAHFLSFSFSRSRPLPVVLFLTFAHAHFVSFLNLPSRPFYHHTSCLCCYIQFQKCFAAIQKYQRVCILFANAISVLSIILALFMEQFAGWLPKTTNWDHAKIDRSTENYGECSKIERRRALDCLYWTQWAPLMRLKVKVKFICANIWYWYCVFMLLRHFQQTEQRLEHKYDDTWPSRSCVTYFVRNFHTSIGLYISFFPCNRRLFSFPSWNNIHQNIKKQSYANNKLTISATANCALE